MGPVLQQLAQMEHEHDAACRIKVAPDQRHGDGGGIQHGHGQLSVEQGFQPGGHIGNGPPRRQHRPDGQGQEQLGKDPAHHGAHQFILKFPVQGPGSVLRHKVQGLGFFIGEGREGPKNVISRAGVDHNGVSGPVKDLNAPDPGNAL